MSDSASAKESFSAHKANLARGRGFGALPAKKIPLGASDFEKIRREGYLCADKTRYFRDLAAAAPPLKALGFREDSPGKRP
jgi:hypothetical protein